MSQLGKSRSKISNDVDLSFSLTLQFNYRNEFYSPFFYFFRPQHINVDLRFLLRLEELYFAGGAVCRSRSLMNLFLVKDNERLSENVQIKMTILDTFLTKQHFAQPKTAHSIPLPNWYQYSFVFLTPFNLD